MEVKEIRQNIAKSDNQAIAAAWPGVELVTTRGLNHRGILRDDDVIKQVVEFIQS